MTYHLTSPVEKERLLELKAGDEVYLSGVVYTGRDAAHKRIHAMVEKGEPLPFDLKGQIIYYVGPCPAQPGKVIGSAGPTTSLRMDAYAPRFIEAGLYGMIGKGARGDNVVEAMKRFGAVYFGAVGGAGALMAASIKKAEVIAFEDLGTEAVRRLEVENLPLVVVIDSKGNDLYKTGRAKYEIK